jgi:GNAT superfamily N-acetyltransferase
MVSDYARILCPARIFRANGVEATVPSPTSVPTTPEGRSISLRRLSESDVEAYRALRLSALATDPLAFGSTLELESSYDRDRWADRVRRGATSANEAAWIAETGTGEMVGLIGAFSQGDSFHLFGMWVRPDHRGGGIGRRLLERLLDWISTAHPSSPVLLSVNPMQVAAVRLYLAHGFRPTGVVEPLGHTPGAVVHEMRWAGRATGEGRTG